MNGQLKRELIEAADKCENAHFIGSDPVQFPHRYTDRHDIEVSAFISAWMAYGSRRVFLDVLEKIHTMMDAHGGPYRFISNRCFNGMETDAGACLYRFYKWSDFLELCDRLAKAYDENDSLEAFFQPGHLLDEGVANLCSFFEGVQGIPVPGSTSANKRFYMFLRWMVRRNSPVDFGIWTNVSPSQLIVPLDTHVYQAARRMGLTLRNSADLKTAKEITEHMTMVWPDDPARADFSLYGMEVSDL